MFYDSVTAPFNLINVIMIGKVPNLYSRICIMEVVPTDTQDTQLHIRVKQKRHVMNVLSHCKIDLMNAQTTYL